MINSIFFFNYFYIFIFIYCIKHLINIKDMSKRKHKSKKGSKSGGDGDFDDLNLDYEDSDSKQQQQSNLNAAQKLVGTTKKLIDNRMLVGDTPSSLGVPKQGGPRQSNRIAQPPPEPQRAPPPQQFTQTEPQQFTKPEPQQFTQPEPNEIELQRRLNVCNDKEKALTAKVLDLLKKIVTVHNATTQLDKNPVKNPAEIFNDPIIIKSITSDNDAEEPYTGTLVILNDLYQGMKTKKTAMENLQQQLLNTEGNNVKFTAFKSDIDNIIKEIDEKFKDYPDYPVSPLSDQSGETTTEGIQGTLYNMGTVRNTIFQMLDDMKKTKEEIAGLKNIDGVNQRVITRVLTHLDQVHTEFKLEIEGYPFAKNSIEVYNNDPDKLEKLLDVFLVALVARIRALETDIANLTDTIAANKAALDTAANLLRDAIAANVVLTGTVTDLNKELAAMKAKLTGVTGQLATMKNTSAGNDRTKDDKIAELQNKVAELQVEVGVLKSQVDTLKTERDVLQASLNQCTSEAVILKATITELRGKLDAAAAAAAAAAADNAAAYSTGNAKTGSIISTLNVQLTEAKNEIEQLKREKVDKINQIASMKNMIRNLDGRLAKAELAAAAAEKLKRQKTVVPEVGDADKIMIGFKTRIAELERELLNAESSVVCPDTCASDRINLDDPASKIIDIVKKIYTKYPDAAGRRKMSDSQLTNNKANLDTLKDHLKDLWTSSGSYKSAPQSGRGSSNRYNVGNELVTWNTSPDWLKSVTLWIHGNNMIEAKYPQSIVDSLKSNTSYNSTELNTFAKKCHFI
jgi:predicted  nucleic acid-binding Zn-ribbon protein